MNNCILRDQSYLIYTYCQCCSIRFQGKIYTLFCKTLTFFLSGFFSFLSLRKISNWWTEAFNISNSIFYFILRGWWREKTQEHNIAIWPAELVLNRNKGNKSIKNSICYKYVFESNRKPDSAYKYFIDYNGLYLLNILLWLFKHHFFFMFM